MTTGGIRQFTVALQFILATVCFPMNTEAQVAPSDQQAVSELLKFNAYLISDLVGEFYSIKAQGLYGPKDVERTREKRRYDWWPKRKMSEVYILDKAEEKGLELMSDPNFDGQPGALTRIIPNLHGLMSEVLCFYRSTHDSKTYEYWVVKIWQSNTETRSISFLVTVAETLEKPRQILAMNDQYIREFKVSEEFTISFPESDLSVLHKMQAWLYPMGFPDSELKNKEVILSREAGYLAGPYDPNAGVQVWRDMTPKEVEEFFNVN